MGPDDLNLRSGFVGVSAGNCPKFAYFRELSREKVHYEDSMAERVGFCLSLRSGLQDKQCLCGFHSIQAQLPPQLKAEAPSDNQGFCHRFWKKQRVKSDGVYPQNW